MTGDFLIVKKYLSNPLVTGTIFLTLAGTTSRFMGFFFRIFLNNVMGSTGLGLYQLVIPLMSVCMSLCCNGFQTATSKLVAEKPQNRQIILICAIIMSATIALLLTIIMYSNANYISLCILSEPRCTELVKALSFSILPAAIHSCINGYYYGLKKAAVPAATQLIEQTARIGTCYLIYAILSDGGSCFKPVYSIYGIVAGEASATVFSVITIKKDFSCGRTLALQRRKTCPSVRTPAWPVCSWSWARMCILTAALKPPSTRACAGVTPTAICARACNKDPGAIFDRVRKDGVSASKETHEGSVEEKAKDANEGAT